MLVMMIILVYKDTKRYMDFVGDYKKISSTIFS